MISMEGVPSSLILRNESWVRQQAQTLARRLPANVEKADLIQAGLIAVAHAALGFEWEGDRETPEAKDAFVRYARQRVHGAMLDELRNMDHLSRGQRRQVKLLQLARERWRSTHDNEATATELSGLCGLSVDEIFALDNVAAQAQQHSTSNDAGSDDDPMPHEAATERDEVEARVDTGMLMRRLEGFFATLPERDRRVIDAYLGVGLSPTQLALALNVSPSRLSQMFKSVCDRIGVHLGPTAHRSTDRVASGSRARLDELIAQREAQLARPEAGGAWGAQLQKALGGSKELDERYPPDQPIVIESGTRWG
jgi:RNA polymerase sigma factor for flagellar operon FliA